MFNNHNVRAATCAALCALGAVLSINAGVSADTMVVTPAGFKPIGELNVGDTVVCLSKTFSPKSNIVTAVQDLELKSAFDIVTDDGVVMRVSPEQRFFVANKWVRADQLTIGDMLLKQDRGFIGVTGIHYQQGPVKMRFISVKLHHNFLVSQNGVLVHNGPFGATFGVYFGKFAVHFVAHSAILIAGAMTGPAAPATIASLEAAFLPTIEAASHVGALAGGIICGVATGPA